MKNIPCSKCNSKAITFIRYSGRHLCKKHFNEFFEKKVKRGLREQFLHKSKKIVLGISGGKDSTIALYMLQKFLSKTGTEIICLTVDEGIKGYREEGIKKVRMNSNKLGIEHATVSFEKNFGIKMDDVAKLFGKKTKKTPCTYCGVFRRYCLNKFARETGADRVATGLNLDDTVQSILMNLARGDVEKLARMGPHLKEQEGLIQRIQPLRYIPEKESLLYAILNNIEFHNAICPYSEHAWRNKYRELILSLEKDSPGTMYGILSSYDKIRPILEGRYKQEKLNKCKYCNEPTIKEVCEACGLLFEIKKFITK
ncbi:MAG: TIGR00269 family protein [Candidatus Thermoplasmatota archaeon]